MTHLPTGGPNRLLDLWHSIPLTWRLFWDRGTPLWTKSIPLLTLGYLLWPLDLLADPILGLGQLDDLAVLMLGLRLFVYAVDRTGQGTPPTQDSQDDVIDAEFRVKDDK